MAKPTPLILTNLDGWGFSPASEGNAIALARKPNYDNLLSEYPNTLIKKAAELYQPVFVKTGRPADFQISSAIAR